MSLRWSEKDLAAFNERRGNSSRGGGESRPARLGQAGMAREASRSPTGRLASPEQVDAAGVASGLRETTVVIVLRGEPRGKGRSRSRIVFRGRARPFIAVYTPKETRVYERALAAAGQAAMQGRPPLDGPLEVSVQAIMGVPVSWTRPKRDAALVGTIRPTSRPDIDNIFKCLDGLNGIVFHDDSQISRATIDKRYGEEPMMWVEVKVIGAFDA